MISLPSGQVNGGAGLEPAVRLSLSPVYHSKLFRTFSSWTRRVSLLTGVEHCRILVWNARIRFLSVLFAPLWYTLRIARHRHDVKGFLGQFLDSLKFGWD